MHNKSGTSNKNEILLFRRISQNNNNLLPHYGPVNANKEKSTSNRYTLPFNNEKVVRKYPETQNTVGNGCNLMRVRSMEIIKPMSTIASMKSTNLIDSETEHGLKRSDLSENENVPDLMPIM